MKHTVYVASSWRNTYQPSVVAALRDAGHEVYDFRDGAGFSWSEVDPAWESWTTAGWEEGLHTAAAEAGFGRDLRGMQAATLFVVVLPCGRSAHLEAGWACGRGLPTLFWVPPQDRVEPDLMVMLAGHDALVVGDLSALVERVTKTPRRTESEAVTSRVDLYRDDRLTEGEVIDRLIHGMRGLLRQFDDLQAAVKHRARAEQLAVAERASAGWDWQVHQPLDPGQQRGSRADVRSVEHALDVAGQRFVGVAGCGVQALELVQGEAPPLDQAGDDIVVRQLAALARAVPSHLVADHVGVVGDRLVDLVPVPDGLLAIDPLDPRLVSAESQLDTRRILGTPPDILTRIDEVLAGATPGPWSVANEDEAADGALIVSLATEMEDGEYVVDVAHCFASACVEDARLIAAAPGLLAEARDEIAKLRERLVTDGAVP